MYVCMLGYPVLKQKVEFKKKGKCANRTDWSKFIMNIKVEYIHPFIDPSLHSSILPFIHP